MNFIYSCILALYTTLPIKNQYRYILIITGKNCSPCIVAADGFFATNKITYKLINIYQNKAEKNFSEEAIKNFCRESRASARIDIKNTYKFGKYVFQAKDGGPFIIKYSGNDTLIYNSLNIDNVSAEDKLK